MVPGYSLCSFPSLDPCLTPETQCLAYAFYRVVYNVFFHPLREYPGPWHRGASRLPYTISIFRGDVTFRVKALHDKYGKVVRITPDTLSYTDSQAWSGMWMVGQSVPQSLLILAFFPFYFCLFLRRRIQPQENRQLGQSPQGSQVLRRCSRHRGYYCKYQPSTKRPLEGTAAY